MRDAARRQRNFALILAMFLVACSKGEAHDLGKWAGVPWALSGAVLPDDRHSIIDWFAPNIAPKFRHFQTYDHTVFGYVTRSGSQGDLTARAVVPNQDGWYPGPNNIVGTSCRRPCTPRDILAAVAKSEEWTTMLEYLDPDAPLNLVAVAVDTHNEFGFTTDSDAFLFFARPEGKWVFLISASTPADLQTITNVLVDRLAS